MDLDRLHPTYFYAGPWNAKFVVVGQKLAEGGTYPFAGAHDTLFAWEGFGAGALEMGWTNIQEIPPQLLREKSGIISCGKRAGKWLEYVVNGDVPTMLLPTPQYIFTRHTESEVADIYKEVKTFVEINKIKGQKNDGKNG
jgi:hypothetical protein